MMPTRSLRGLIEPILLERAAGRDGLSLITPLLDHAQGDSKYDRFISEHGVVPVTVELADTIGGDQLNSDDWLPTDIPFGSKLTDPNERATLSSFDGIDGDVTPLLIDGPAPATRIRLPAPQTGIFRFRISVLASGSGTEASSMLWRAATWEKAVITHTSISADVVPAMRPGADCLEDKIEGHNTYYILPDRSLTNAIRPESPEAAR